jgi:Type II secretory pathway, component PulF
VPYFAYKAADQRGQTIDGVMEASDARSVVERLPARRLLSHSGRAPARAPRPVEPRPRCLRFARRSRARSRGLHLSSRDVARGGPSSRSRSRHPGRAGGKPPAPQNHQRRAQERPRGDFAGRGARQAPPASLLTPLREHDQGGRARRLPRANAPAPRRVPRGGAGVPRHSRLRPHLSDPPRRGGDRGRHLPHDLRHPPLRGHLP